jgi:hypothetical protein
LTFVLSSAVPIVIGKERRPNAIGTGLNFWKSLTRLHRQLDSQHRFER